MSPGRRWSTRWAANRSTGSSWAAGKIQTRCGAIDHAVETEAEALEVRGGFSPTCPSSVFELPPKTAPSDDPERRDEFLFEAIPRDRRKVYRMRPIVEAVVDKGSFFEMGRMFGRGMITGFARLDGVPVAVMASDPFFYGGAWTADVCDKIIRFVDLAEDVSPAGALSLRLPTGFHIGVDAEKAATIRKGVRAMAAVNQSSVPWCTFLVRNVFGVAGAVNQPSGRFSIRYAWLSARWGSLPLEGGIEAAYRAEIDAAPDPKAKIAEIEERLNLLRSPFRTAETFWVEEIIDPRDTRRLAVDFARPRGARVLKSRAKASSACGRETLELRSKHKHGRMMSEFGKRISRGETSRLAHAIKSPKGFASEGMSSSPRRGRCSFGHQRGKRFALAIHGQRRTSAWPAPQQECLALCICLFAVKRTCP